MILRLVIPNWIKFLKDVREETCCIARGRVCAPEQPGQWCLARHQRRNDATWLVVSKLCCNSRLDQALTKKRTLKFALKGSVLEPYWWELNPRNTSVLGSECVLVDVNRQAEGKSAHLCLWFNVDLPACSFSNSPLVTPFPSPPPPPPLSLSLSFPSLARPFGERQYMNGHQQIQNHWRIEGLSKKKNTTKKHNRVPRSSPKSVAKSSQGKKATEDKRQRRKPESPGKKLLWRSWHNQNSE